MIYFIKSESGHVKIGYTDNGVKTRLSQLQTANPFKLSLLKTIDGDFATERLLHRKFKKYLFNNREWFTLNNEIMNFIKNPYQLKQIKRKKKKPIRKMRFNLSVEDCEKIAENVNRNPQHIAKIARGERPCPAKLALLIEKATGGLIRKEQLVDWD